MPNIHTPIDCTSFHACASCTVQRHPGHLVNSRQITMRFSKQVRDDSYLPCSRGSGSWVAPTLRPSRHPSPQASWPRGLGCTLACPIPIPEYGNVPVHTHTLLHINHTHCTQSQSYTNTIVWECANRHTHIYAYIATHTHTHYVTQIVFA